MLMPPALSEIWSCLHALGAAQSLMAWDQQVMMQPGGAEDRAHIQTKLAEIRHSYLSSDELGKAIEEAEKGASTDEAKACVRVLRLEYDEATKLPAEFVKRRAKTSADAYAVWKKARANNDFKSMEPYYAEHVAIARETADLLGFKDHPYDALINTYEEGMTTVLAASELGKIRKPISELVKAIQTDGKPNDDSVLNSTWDEETLRKTCQDIASRIGFDFNRGRLDITPNAFCTDVGSRNDVRLTTRASNHIKGILSSTLHEMGHGLYEQCQSAAWNQSPLCGGVSYAVHESQSRTWENVVGRSLPFWQHFFPTLQKAFPTQLGAVKVEDFYRMLNRVQPEFIRVGADELTYNLHIIVRFELEVALIEGKLDVRDLPEAWNAKYSELLGITPTSDSVGVLQDVHWSRGSIGYFPTYALGNLIGVQIYDTLQASIGNQDAHVAKGNFEPMLSWLTKNLYEVGKVLPPAELLHKVTGSKLDSGPWVAYAEAKYKAIYGLA